VLLLLFYIDPAKKYLSRGTVNVSLNISDIKVVSSIVALFVISDLQIENILSVCGALIGNKEKFIFRFDLRGNTYWRDGFKYKYTFSF
jgi:hypothetical protein